MHKTAPRTILWAVLIATMTLIPGSAGAADRKLPKFKIQLVDGTTVNSRDLAGKVVVIDFWGTWCKPCLAEIPAYNAFYREYKDKGVRFLALAADSGSSSQVRDAAQRLKIEYPVAAPSWDALDLFGEIQVFPTTMIFDKKGRLEEEFFGVPPGKHERLHSVVSRLLQSR